MSELKSQTLVADVVAEAEFDRFADSCRLDRKMRYMDENDARDFTAYRGLIVDAIMEGRVTIGDDGLPTQHTLDGKELKWTRPTGQAYLAMDRKKKDASIAKACAAIGTVLKVPSKVIGDLDVEDFNLTMAIFSVFTA